MLPMSTVCAGIARASLLLLVLSAGAGGQTVCGTCHAAIYQSYRTTPMARSARKLDAGTAPERFDRAAFTHRASGFQYRVSPEYTMEFSKTGGASGRKTLAYAIGSGTRAYSYLLEEDGFLYEAPVAYYGASHAWNLEPGYEGYSYPYLTRPIAPGCLACHASGVQAVPLTLNRYASPAFQEGGVSCERCHGEGTKHAAAGDGTAILNPAKLPPAQRDSICGQCHLTGAVRVMRAGADWRSFQPGGRLSDSMTVFVRSPGQPGMRVTGHVEDLALSACKRKSGDRMWCGSCHDPHVVPARASFRQRCLVCHEQKPCTETRAARVKVQDDCIGCHMPRSTATDAQHVVLTDHSIPRRPRREEKPSQTAELESFGGGQASSRDLALAYAIAAVGKTGGSDRARATNLLEKVVRDKPDDVDVLLYLAEIYRTGDNNDRARPLYERAIRIDPGQVTGSVGLGGIMMERGDYAAAVRLWTDALTKNAGLELVRLNLAVALLRMGDKAGAETNLRKALTLNPAFPPAKDLLQKLYQPLPH
jgi:hypothetical protein